MRICGLNLNLGLPLLSTLLLSTPVIAAPARIAIASNFADAGKKLAQLYQQQTGHKLQLIFGSTGKHYAQIINGAPFDALLAADTQRPLLLEKQGIALPGTRFTYAIGKLALWSNNPKLIDKTGSILRSGKFNYLAIANPKLAPYGKAAKQLMQAQGIWQQTQQQLVRGENIAQTYHFVHSGGADLGLVAYSQIKQLSAKKPAAVIGSYWLPPESLYPPIKQQAVLLNNESTAQHFLHFLRTEQAKQIIQTQGYAIDAQSTRP